MENGHFEIEILNLGTISLDGGGVFGIIPKALWERLIPSDSRNRVTLGLNSLLIKSREINVLVDPGLGTKLSSRQIEIYGLDGNTALLELLKQRGIRPEAISHVFLSHLHFISSGSSTFLGKNEVVPTFPNAQYFAQQAEWEEAANPNERTRGSYFRDDYMPLIESGRLRLVNGTQMIVPGIEVILTGGHTAGHQCVAVSTGSEKVVFLGHLIPTEWHLAPHYIMAHDLYPAQTLAAKKRLLEQAANEKWLVVFLNNPKNPAGRIERTENGFVFDPVDLDLNSAFQKRDR